MPWQSVPRANFMFLHAARLQAHYAAQWLARAARAYVPAEPHDRHTSLGWDDAFGGLDHASAAGRLAAWPAHRRSDARLSRSHPHALPLDGRADAEVRTWLGGHVAARNLAAGKLDDPLPYAMPDHVLARGARYSLDELGDALDGARHVVCQRQRGARRRAEASRGARLKAPPVRSLAAPFRHGLPRSRSARGRSMGIGYCPGDEFCDEPYFYTSMWPEPSIPALPLLPAMAHWHTYKFLAALAPAHKIVAAHDQGAYVRQFLDVSVAAALNALR